MRIAIVVALALSLADAACAQDSFPERWTVLRNAQPAGVTFSISASKTRFYLGELMSLCSGQECRESVESWIRGTQGPRRVEIDPYLSDARIRIAQYLVIERDLSIKLR